MDVRFLDVNTVAAETLALWERWLAPEKRQRIDRLPQEHRLQSLCADGLAREMLGEKLGLAPAEICFTYSKSGKPLTEGTYFSVSHSGSAVGCAVSDREVGLDLEKLRPVPQRLARRFGCGEDASSFWQRWTRREAAVKCRGGTPDAWKQEREENLHFVPLAVPEGYAAAVCEKI